VSSNSNGMKTTMWIFAVVIFPTLFFMGSNIIANDKARQDEDKQIRTEYREDVKEICEKSAETDQKVAVALERIFTKLEAIEKKVK